MAINPFAGFTYDKPQDIRAFEDQQIQQAMLTGDRHAMRAATMAQATNTIAGGSQAYKKAKKTEKVLAEALKQTGGQTDTLQSRRDFLAKAQAAAIEAGLVDIAMQAGDQLLQVTDLELERKKLQTDTEYTSAATDATRGQESRANLAGLRVMETEELVAQRAALESAAGRTDSEQAKDDLQNRIARIDAIIEDKRIAFERGKSYEIKEYEIQGADGEPITRTVAINRNDPDDMYVLGEVKTSDIAGAQGGRQLATIEKIADKNRLQGFEASRDYSLARRAYDATSNVGRRGFAGAARTKLLAAFGAEDVAEFNKKLIDQATKVKALDLLPPGSASDKDVQIVMDTVLGPNASAESLREVFKAQMRLAEWEREYTKFMDQYLASADQPSIVGAQVAWTKYAEENVAGLDAKINKRVMDDLGLTPLTNTTPSDTQQKTSVVSVKRRGPK